MRGRIGGVWVTPTVATAYINGAWRTLPRAKAYIAAAWRDVASFVQPLSLSNTPSSGFFASDYNIAYSNLVTATPTGGLGPYTYLWTVFTCNKTITINAPTSATTYISTSVQNGVDAVGTMRCSVTDSLGTVATADSTIALNYY